MRRLLFAILLFVSSATIALAQDSDVINPQEILTQRAEEALKTGRASAEALSVLRNDLDDLRQQMFDIVDAGSIEARVIEVQLSALGPAPDDGSVETEGLAQKRKTLAEQLKQATQPIREAQARLSQVELLIHEVDQLIREKDRNRLFQRFPSVFWPSTIVKGIGEIESYGAGAGTELTEAMGRKEFKNARLERLSLAGFLGVLGLFLIFYVRSLVGRFFDKKFEGSSGPLRFFWVLMSSIARLIVPLVGIVAIAGILPVLGVKASAANFAGQLVLQILSLLVFSNWLGHTLFSPFAPSRRLVRMDNEKALTGLRLCQALGFVEGIERFSETLGSVSFRSPETVSVVAAPIIVVAAVLLWRLAGLLHAGKLGVVVPNDQTASQPADGFANLNKIIVFVLRAAALISAPLVLLGYVYLARQISDAMVMTAANLGIALFLYSILTGSIRALINKGGAESETTLPLMPFFVGLLIATLLLPVLAITWGARPSDVLEVWRMLTVGADVGGMRLSLSVIFSLLFVFCVGVVLTRWMQRGLRETVLPRTKMDIGAQNALITGLGYVGMTLSTLIAVSVAGLNLSNLAVVAGALSVGIGFGLQTIVSNFVSGIILLIERPIAEGDWIEVSGHSGIVKKIAVRSTQIATFDKHDVIVPNQDLIGGAVKNMTLSSRMGRLIIPVGVAYGSDLEKTKEILETAAADEGSLVKYPAPSVLFRGLGDSSLDFELRCYLRDVDTMLSTQSDLLFRIYVDLSKAGIEIPFPQRDVNLRDLTVKHDKPGQERSGTE